MEKKDVYVNMYRPPFGEAIFSYAIFGKEIEGQRFQRIYSSKNVSQELLDFLNPLECKRVFLDSFLPTGTEKFFTNIDLSILKGIELFLKGKGIETKILLK